MQEETERTNLLRQQFVPQYAYNSRAVRERKRRVKQFQCCLCSLFICFAACLIVVGISYCLQYDIPLNDTTENDDSSQNEDVQINFNSFFLVPNARHCPTIEDDARWPNQDEQEALHEGEEALKEKEKIERDVPLLEEDTPSYRHQKVTATSKKATHLARAGYMEELVTLLLWRTRNTTNDVLVCNKPHRSSICYNKWIKCDRNAKYRTYDGTCNNLKNPKEYGVSYRPFRRILAADYADGVSQPRVSKNGTPLPSARLISQKVHKPYYRSDSKFTVMLAVWGQFLDHDITATALSHTSNGGSISCCTGKGPVHPECFPVVEKIGKNNVTCMEFVRSAPAPKCKLGPREQMNQMTSFIDGSVIYGVDEGTVKRLRTLKEGQLKMHVTKDNRTLLPFSEDSHDGCNRVEEKRKGRYCFMTGDSRANENLHLTSLHLIMARQHNLVAKKLGELNPHWDDERIFQESRRIIGAQMQHISYREFLPSLFGPTMMETKLLKPASEGSYQGYDVNVDPSIFNSFATAAFRFAHSIIPGLMKFLANDTSSPEFIRMHEMLFNPFQLYQPGELDKTLRGAMATNIEANDAYFTNELKQHLFEQEPQKNISKKLPGLDLVSLNIQRGRDHGIPGYIHWRAHCNLSLPQNFSDLEGVIDQGSLKSIQEIYNDVEDIDLYSGAIAEIPPEGEILGPTMSCLIMDQFERIRKGDRFWYENPNLPNSFTLDQMNEIKKTTLAKVICDNSDNVQTIQPWVMATMGPGNEYTNCTELSEPDLRHWKDSNLSRVHIGQDQLTVITV